MMVLTYSGRGVTKGVLSSKSEEIATIYVEGREVRFDLSTGKSEDECYWLQQDALVSLKQETILANINMATEFNTVSSQIRKSLYDPVSFLVAFGG